MEKKKDTRFRNWTFLQYEDSAPENWRSLLDELNIPWVESPLHDSDLNADGTKKKPHRHIVLAFSGKKSFEQIQEISNLVSGVKPLNVNDMRNMCRYLTHMDNPEKAQYSRSDVICHGGFDIDNFVKLSTAETKTLMHEMFRFIHDNNVISYSDFIDYCMQYEKDDWFDVATMKHTLAVKEYIKSFAYLHTHIDPDTGEAKMEGRAAAMYNGDDVKLKIMSKEVK